LRRQGVRILARNYTCPQGELDLVARDGTCIVFVEVRSTGSDDVSRPASSVDLAKQRRLTDLAVYFLTQHRLLDHPARFDVLALTWPPGQREPAVTHYRNAFEAIGRYQMFQ
jgi:putative endonuclease